LRIFALGGLGEIGKNMYVVQYGNDIVVIDSGLMFPDKEMLGVDVVIPDITYLIENQSKIRGIILTHGHEDHIGGVPYIFKHLQAPLYATKLTMAIVEHKLKEAQLLNNVKRIVVSNNSKIVLGKMTASFFHVNHSIPDAVGVALDTPEGVVVHTGDFKFDLTPTSGRYADIHKMAAVGAKGVLCLLSDSTNAEKKGFAGSELPIGRVIKDVFMRAEQRVIVSTFASNIYRLQQVVDACVLTKRKLAVLGRSMVNTVNISTECGYLNMPKGMLIDPEEVSKLPAQQVAIISTGSQGEVMSALTRMANLSHRKVEISPGDTIIIAATPIPGNERAIGQTIDQLFRMGAKVVYSAIEQIHVSGHGAQEDLKLMLNLIKPKYFMPIHGEHRMLRAHALLAKEVGVNTENIFVCDNGDVVEFCNNRAKKATKIPTGRVLIDGLGVGDVGNIVIRDRKLLSQDGIIVVVLTIQRDAAGLVKVVSGPDIISRGFVYVRESTALLEEANYVVCRAVTQCVEEKIFEWSSLKNGIKEALGKFLFDKIRRRPMILPIIMEV
jgi:ribonuclease J